MNPEIKEVVCYETSDGKLWNTLIQAENWRMLQNTFLTNLHKESPQKSFRSWGEDDHIDKYHGRN